jgi:hypothetical protein
MEEVRPAEQVVNERFFGCWFVIRFELDQLLRPRLVLLRALVPGEKQNARATLFRDERVAELIVRARGDVERKRKLGEKAMRVVREPAAGEVEPIVERLSLKSAEPSGQLNIDSLPERLG